MNSEENTSPEPQASNAGAENEPDYPGMEDHGSDEPLEEALREILLGGQGDDDGAQIMPDFEDGQSVRSMVHACIALLETRRDVIEGYANTEAQLRHRLAALTTPEPQTGERDGEVVGYVWPDELSRFLQDDQPRITLHRVTLWPGSKPLVRQSTLLAERTAREAAEHRLAEVEERAKEDAGDHVYALWVENGWLEPEEHGVMLPAARATLRAKPEAQAIVGKEADHG